MTDNPLWLAEKSKYVSPYKSDRRLLILSCSRKKKAGVRLLPAIERYDGPAFQVLRKFIVECPTEARKLDIYIISAKFGMIPANQQIPCYDSQMNAHRAIEFNPAIITELKRLLTRRRYRKLMINVGQNYLSALAGHESLVSSDLVVTSAAGSLGRKQTMLRDWLRGEPQMPLSITPQGRARIRGIEIVLTPEEVMERACRALVSGNGSPQAYQSWYVQVDGQRVSPKWLVHQLTGMSVGEFHSDEARRVLQQLGIGVHRV